MPVFLNRQAAARYRALASIIPGREMVKVKVSPTTGRRDGPRGSGWVKTPDFLTFGTTRVVGRQPHAPAAFTPGESLVLIF